MSKEVLFKIFVLCKCNQLDHVEKYFFFIFLLLTVINFKPHNLISGIKKNVFSANLFFFFDDVISSTLIFTDLNIKVEVGKNLARCWVHALAILTIFDARVSFFDQIQRACFIDRPGRIKIFKAIKLWYKTTNYLLKVIEKVKLCQTIEVRSRWCRRSSSFWIHTIKKRKFMKS